jgi:steroid Delta-isomerase
MTTARDLAIASLDAVRAKDREGWLALFTDDAVVEDPVGKSPLDPSGQGHRGRAAIARFYDEVIARNEAFDYRIRESHLCGNVASAATFTITGADARQGELDLVTIHRMSADGRIAALRAFWKFPAASAANRTSGG